MESRVFCTLCFVSGLLTPRLASSQFILLLTLLTLVTVWREKLRTPLTSSLIVLSFLAGLGRAAWDEQSSTPQVPTGPLRVEGTILEPPRRWGSSSVFFFRVEVLDDQVLDAPFKLLVRWSRCEQSLAPGDRWALSGRFGAGERAQYPGGYDQAQWLWSQNAEGLLQLNKFSSYHFLSPPLGLTPHQLSYRARAWMMRRLGHIPNDTQLALVAGVVFGETQSLPKTLQDQFRRTGTSHLLAASGMNVALLAGLILGLGKLLGYGPWRLAPWAIPAVISYAFLAGCGPSITRAATGTTLALFAMWMGRRSCAWNSLSLSVWFLLLWDPRQIYDLGFQLSAVAVVGLVGGPKAPENWNWIHKSLVLTFSASLVTLPFFWSAFGEISSTLLLANLVLGPIVELLFPLGLLLTLCPLKPLVLGTALIAQISLLLVEWLSQLADPICLTKPTWEGWILLSLASLSWLKDWSFAKRCLAIPLVAAALGSSLYLGRQAEWPRDTLILRRIGIQKPIYWLSHEREELLVLTAEWQAKRARSMVRDLGCLRSPKVMILGEEEAFEFNWKGFHWEALEPLLPGSPYLEVRVKDGKYTLRTWGT